MFNGSSLLKSVTGYGFKLIQALIPQDDSVISLTPAKTDTPPSHIARTTTETISLPYAAAVMFVEGMSQLILKPGDVADADFQRDRTQKDTRDTLKALRVNLEETLNYGHLAHDPCVTGTDVLNFYVGTYQTMVREAESKQFPAMLRDQMHKAAIAAGIARDTLLHHTVEVRSELFKRSPAAAEWRANYGGLVRETLKAIPATDVPDGLKYLFDGA